MNYRYNFNDKKESNKKKIIYSIVFILIVIMISATFFRNSENKVVNTISSVLSYPVIGVKNAFSWVGNGAKNIFTNKDKLLSCKDVLDKFNQIIVIDHHNITEETLNINNLFNDSNYSSTCEIITELLRSFKINLTPKEATVILSGIVLDTNNFILKSTKKTFYNSYFLLNKGASTIEVQYLLKQDLNKFITRQKMLTNVIIKNNIAIACGVEKELYRREDLAKIADTLLLFNNISSSFVIAYLEKDVVGISGRNLNKVNVGEILTKLGGGGNEYEAACNIIGKNIKEVKKELIEILK